MPHQSNLNEHEAPDARRIVRKFSWVADGQSRSGKLRAKWVGPGQRRPRYGEDARKALAQQAKAARPEAARIQQLAAERRAKWAAEPNKESKLAQGYRAEANALDAIAGGKSAEEALAGLPIVSRAVLKAFLKRQDAAPRAVKQPKRVAKQPHLDRHVKALEDLGGRIGEGKATLPDVLSTILHLGGTLKAGDLAALATRLGSTAKPKSKDDGMRAIHDALVARYRTARTRFNSEKSFAELQSDFKTTRGTMAGVTTDGRKVYGKEYERLKAKKAKNTKRKEIISRLRKERNAQEKKKALLDASFEAVAQAISKSESVPFGNGRESYQSEHHEAVANTWRGADKRSADLATVASQHFPPKAMADIAKGLDRIEFFSDRKSARSKRLWDDFLDGAFSLPEGGVVKKAIFGAIEGAALPLTGPIALAVAGGIGLRNLWRRLFEKQPEATAFYSRGLRKIYMPQASLEDNNTVEEADIRGTLVHEMAHAMDAGKGYVSLSGEWKEAFEKEIKKPLPIKNWFGSKYRITEYATSSPTEGFAEFARLLYATKSSLHAIKRAFPKASAIFIKNGWWPSKKFAEADADAPIHIPELFLPNPLVPLMEKLGLPVPDMMLPKKKPTLRKFSEPLRHIRNVEIFATGRHRDEQYDEPYLDRVAENFKKLGKILKPTVVIGHEEEQDLLDNTGIPAVGVVEKVWKTKVPCRVCEGAGKFEGKPCPGCKGTLKQTLLKADFADVPPQIADLVNKRAYRQVSAELYDDFDHQGHNYGPALRRVAMLGGELPQVKTLKDLPFATFSAGRRARSVRFFCDGAGRCHIVRPSTMKPRLVRVGGKLVVQFAECKKCDKLQPCPQCANKVEKFAQVQFQTFKTKGGGVGVLTATGQKYYGKEAQRMIASARQEQQKAAQGMQAQKPNRKPLDVSKLDPWSKSIVMSHAKQQGVSLDTHDVIGRNPKTGAMVFRPKQGGAAPSEQKTQKVVQPKPQAAPKPKPAAKKQRSEVELAKPLKGDGEVYLGPGERDPEGTFDADAYEAGEKKPESIMTKDNIESFEFFPDEDDPSWADKWEVFETVKQARRSKTTTGNVQMDSNGMIRRRKKPKEQAFSELRKFAAGRIYTRSKTGGWKAEFPGTNRKPVYGKEAERLMKADQKAARTQAAKQVAARQAMGGKVGLAAAKAKGERAAKQLGMEEARSVVKEYLAKPSHTPAEKKALESRAKRLLQDGTVKPYHPGDVKAATKQLRKEMMVAPADAAKQGVTDKTHYGVRNPRTGEILGYMPRGGGPSAEQVKARIAEWRKQHDENMASVVATVKADYDDAAKLTTYQANQAAKYIENANLPKPVIQEIAKAVNIPTRGGRTGKQLKKLIAEAIRERHGLALRAAADFDSDPGSKALLAKNNLVSDESMQDFLDRIGGATSDYLDGARLPSGEYMPAGANEKRGDFLARFDKARKQQLADQEKAAYEQALKDAYTVVRKRRQGITNEQAAQEVENEVRKKFKFKHYKPPTKNSGGRTSKPAPATKDDARKLYDEIRSAIKFPPRGVDITGANIDSVKESGIPMEEIDAKTQAFFKMPKAALQDFLQEQGYSAKDWTRKQMADHLRHFLMKLRFQAIEAFQIGKMRLSETATNFADCQRRITEFCMEGKNKGKPGPCPGQKQGEGKAGNILARMQAKKKDAATPAQFKPAWSKSPDVTPPPEMPKDIPVAQPVAQPVQVVIRMENGVPTLAKAEPAAQPGVVDSIQRPRQKIEGPVAAPAPKESPTVAKIAKGLWDTTKAIGSAAWEGLKLGGNVLKGLGWMLLHKRKSPGGFLDPKPWGSSEGSMWGGIIPRAYRLFDRAGLMIASGLAKRSELGQKVIRLTMMAERILARRQGRPPRRWKGSTIIRVANQQIRRFAEELKGGAGLTVRPFRTFDVGGGLKSEFKTSRGTMAGITHSGRPVYGKEYRRLKQQQAAKVKPVAVAAKPKVKQDAQDEIEEATAEAIGKAADILKGTWKNTAGALLGGALKLAGKAGKLAVGEKDAKAISRVWNKSLGKVVPDIKSNLGYAATGIGRKLLGFTLDKDAIARAKADRIAWAKEVALAKKEGRPEPKRPFTGTQLYKELRALYSPTGELNLIHANTGVAPWVYKSLKKSYGKTAALLGTTAYTAGNLLTGGSGLGAGTAASYLLGGALGIPVLQGAALLQGIPFAGPWLARGKNAILAGLTKGGTWAASKLGGGVDRLAKWMLGGDKSKASQAWSKFWGNIGKGLDWTAGKAEKASAAVGKAVAHGVDWVPRAGIHGVNLLLRPFGKGVAPAELNRRIDAQGGAPEWLSKGFLKFLWTSAKKTIGGLGRGLKRLAKGATRGLLFSESPTWLAPAVRCFRETESAHRRVLGLGPSPLTDRQVRVCIEAMVAAAA